MSGALPDQLDPWRAIKSGLSFSGVAESDRLRRLVDALVSLGGTMAPHVRYEIRFERGPDGQALMMGHIQSQMILPCQRCLSDVEIDLDSPLRLGLVRTEEAAQDLAADLDPLILSDDFLCPLDVIEDELLLGIPSVPRHEPGFCMAPAALDDPVVGLTDGAARDRGEVVDTPESSSRQNAFSVLAALKRD
jgi:uncharacterized protein